jgi:hypothetical protein
MIRYIIDGTSIVTIDGKEYQGFSTEKEAAEYQIMVLENLISKCKEEINKYKSEIKDFEAYV